jgi:hypothetical protein
MFRRISRPVIVAGLLMSLSACDKALVTPTSPAFPHESANTWTPSPSPTATAEPSLSISLDIREIPPKYTTPALAYETDGAVLLWSSGTPGSAEHPAADLWVWKPGHGHPRRVFANPHADSSLSIIRGDGAGHYAFVEQNPTLYGPTGWRLWYLRAEGTDPVLVDRGDVDGGLLPFPAMDKERLVWTVLHRTPDGVQSQILEWRYGESKPIVLDAADAREREYLYPSLAGGSLAYTTIDVNADRTALSSAVWLRDLSLPLISAEKLSGDEDAFMGVIGPGVVVWQSPLSDKNPFNGGDLVAYDLDTGETEEIGVGGPVTWHTVGNRLVVGETENVSSLYGYDLLTGARVLLDEASEGPPGTREEVDVRPRVNGDILAFVQGSDFADRELSLMWAALPAR